MSLGLVTRSGPADEGCDGRGVAHESDVQVPLRLAVKNIHRAKHGSDTETYNVDGNFVESKFNEIFERYGRSGPPSPPPPIVSFRARWPLTPRRLRWARIYLRRDKKGGLTYSEIWDMMKGNRNAGDVLGW
jgi:hypothetical protein